MTHYNSPNRAQKNIFRSQKYRSAVIILKAKGAALARVTRRAGTLWPALSIQFCLRFRPVKALFFSSGPLLRKNEESAKTRQPSVMKTVCWVSGRKKNNNQTSVYLKDHTHSYPFVEVAVINQMGGCTGRASYAYVLSK